MQNIMEVKNIKSEIYSILSKNST